MQCQQKGKDLMNIPKDPFILLSYINTQLRDNYPSLEELCKSLCLDEKGIIGKLESNGYLYDKEKNQFL